MLSVQVTRGDCHTASLQLLFLRRLTRRERSGTLAAAMRGGAIAQLGMEDRQSLVDHGRSRAEATRHRQGCRSGAATGGEKKEMVVDCDG